MQRFRSYCIYVKIDKQLQLYDEEQTDKNNQHAWEWSCLCIMGAAKHHLWGLGPGSNPNRTPKQSSCNWTVGTLTINQYLKICKVDRFNIDRVSRQGRNLRSLLTCGDFRLCQASLWLKSLREAGALVVQERAHRLPGGLVQNEGCWCRASTNFNQDQTPGNIRLGFAAFLLLHPV